MYVFVTVRIQHAMRMRHIVICACLPPSKIFSTLHHKWHDFRKVLSKQNVRLNFLYNFFLKHFLVQEEMSEI
jgi:hypothetical protein